jgi:hypothetical protein
LIEGIHTQTAWRSHKHTLMGFFPNTETRLEIQL